MQIISLVIAFRDSFDLARNPSERAHDHSRHKRREHYKEYAERPRHNIGFTFQKAHTVQNRVDRHADQHYSLHFLGIPVKDRRRHLDIAVLQVIMIRTGCRGNTG